jgi:hypothetical protein
VVCCCCIFKYYYSYILIDFVVVFFWCVQDQCASLKSELETTRKCLENAARTIDLKENEIAELKTKLQTANSDMASALSEFSSHKEGFDKEKSDLETKLQEAKAKLAETTLKADRFTALSAMFFVDPVTNEPHLCPIIQNNGVIRSLGEIISIWSKQASMGQSSTFRMFQCPVNQSYTTISPFPIVDALLKLAELSGVDVSLPLYFWFKDSAAAAAAETATGGGGNNNNKKNAVVRFSFHEQLELIARLCEAYSRRNDTSRPPEQRSVSVAGIVLTISMRVLLNEQSSKYYIEIFGSCNDGRGSVCIGVRLITGWIHPFVDLEFTEEEEEEEKKEGKKAD